MGAYLYFRTEGNVDEVTDYLFEENKENMFLESMEEQNIFMCDSTHLKWVKKNRPDMLSWEQKKFGKGDIKTSTDMSSKMVEAGYSQDDLMEMWVKIFEELNERFEMKYYANSCAFSEDEHCFSLSQMKRITNNGKLLSGKTAKSERARELYEIYYSLFSESKFDISLVKEKDYLILDDGEKYRVVKNSHFDLLATEFKTGLKYSYKNLEEITTNIKEHIKYVPRARYDGAICDIESYVLDNGQLVFLELTGTENMVKAITSILMQGNTRMNDKNIEIPDMGYFYVAKAGNRRKLTSLDDGLAHAIVYHSPSIIDADFSILIGRDKEELKTSFHSWLEQSQPLPYPQHLQGEIYESLEKLEKLEEIETFGVEAVKVKLSINESEDDFDGLDDVIVDVCKKAELISEDATPIKANAPLPKSEYLTVGQVERIWDTLNSMPKTYELEDMDIKPIGLKLFSPNFTLYITEADLGNEDDEFANMHTQCYGYIVNESDPQSSEWGYINVPAYLELVYPNGGGFEQDLFFEDKYIDSRGNISSGLQTA